MAHSTRPTLPPLHSLNLPRGNIQLPSIHELLYDLNEQDRQVNTPCLSKTHFLMHTSDDTTPYPHTPYPIPTCPLSASTHKRAGIYADADDQISHAENPSRLYLV